jgi:tetratricopeptide (TPR) repeat protein
MKVLSSSASRTIPFVFVLLLAGLAAGCSGSEKRMVREAETLLERGEFEEAVFFCRRLLKRHPDSPRGLFVLGSAKLHLGQDVEAEAAFERSLQAGGTTGKELGALYLELGLESSRGGSPVRGRRRLMQAHAYDPGLEFGRLDYAVADAYYDQGDFESAIPLYRRALASDSDTTVAESALFRLAASLEAVGREDEARDVYGRFLSHYPGSERKERALARLQNLYYTRAEEEFEAGRLEECLSLLREVLRYASNPLMRDRARFLMGQVFEGMGEYEEARNAYMEIVSTANVGSMRIRERALDRLEQFNDIGLP